MSALDPIETLAKPETSKTPNRLIRCCNGLRFLGDHEFEVHPTWSGQI